MTSGSAVDPKQCLKHRNQNCTANVVAQQLVPMTHSQSQTQQVLICNPYVRIAGLPILYFIQAQYYDYCLVLRLAFGLEGHLTGLYLS